MDLKNSIQGGNVTLERRNGFSKIITTKHTVNHMSDN